MINSARNILGFIDKFNNEAGTLVLTSHGAYAGFCHFMEKRFFAGALCYPIRSKNENLVITKWLFHYFKNIELEIREKYVNKSGVPYINISSLIKRKIPVPALSEQRRIVGVLDKFNTLVNDLSAGLPAEIEARRAQYEHYRETLLKVS